MATPAASPLTSRFFCSFQTAAILHWTTLTVSFDSVASCHQFISEDPANCGFSLLCLYAVKLQFPSLSKCLQSPISISRSAQKPRVLFTHHWFWAAFPPAAICTYFFFYQLSPVPAQFSALSGIHWACASCTIPLQPSSVPT